MKLKLLLLLGLCVALLVGALRIFTPSGDPNAVGPGATIDQAAESRPSGDDALTPPRQSDGSAGLRTAAGIPAPGSGAGAVPNAAAGTMAAWTLEAVIEWPEGMAPSTDFVVYAHETRVSPVSIQSDLSTDTDAITYQSIESQLFEDIERSRNGRGLSLIHISEPTRPY